MSDTPTTTPGETKVFILIDGEGVAEADPQFMEWRQYRKTALADAVKIDHPFRVETLEGTFTAKAGDYLMRGPAGELYSCDGDIFENTYKEA